ncbi:uncharacterized protein LOC127741508 [Arachis duranensis]|uniref:Uncharacterized protein LOC127741508 n=1 Tax=Arachis duranensis TaxID=130453 RepID=A0A9C6TJI0_ARADU|nr:uncharacterized protein LOC127741508 [Arachis duranensis]
MEPEPPIQDIRRELEINIIDEQKVQLSKPLSVVDDELVPKVRMTFRTLEDVGKFYRNYAKAAGFSTRVRCTNRKGNEIKNQLITCSREGKWKSKISPTEKTNPTAGSKQRENQMLQIFIRSYRVQPNPPSKLSFKMCTPKQSLGKSKPNSEERRIASPD